MIGAGCDRLMAMLTLAVVFVALRVGKPDPLASEQVICF